MTKFFAKKLNKKGFTLAEMLIVVAIIAILVAIAVPLFTSQLDKAKKARDEANIRAVRSAAITALLSDDTIDLSQGPWTAKAKVTAQGEMSGLTITEGTSGSESKIGGIDYNSSATTNITVFVSDIDITSATSGLSRIS